MVSSYSGRSADTQLSQEFKASICLIFCDTDRKRWRGCKGCPARTINADTYKTTLISDILQPRKSKASKLRRRK